MRPKSEPSVTSIYCDERLITVSHSSTYLFNPAAFCKSTLTSCLLHKIVYMQSRTFCSYLSSHEYNGYLLL